MKILCANLVIMAVLVMPRSTAAQLRTVALSGMVAPGTTDNVLFTDLRAGAIDNAGRVGFWAGLTGPAGANNGVWSEGLGRLALVAREGQLSPAGDQYFEFTDLTLNSHGEMAFNASQKRHLPDGIFQQDTDGKVRVAVLNHSSAPGGDPNWTFNGFGGVFGLTDQSEVVFTGYVHAGEEQLGGQWSSEDGVVAPVIVPEPRPVLGLEANELVLGHDGWGMIGQAGHVLGAVQVVGPEVTSDNDSALIVVDPTGAARIVAREGDPVPGQSSEQFARLGLQSVNRSGHALFTRFDQDAKVHLYLNDGLNHPILEPGAPVPGQSPGTTIEWVGEATSTLNDSDLTADRVGLSSGRSAFVLTSPSTLDVVLLSDEPAPGLPGLSFDYVPNHWAVNNAGQVMFDQFLKGPGIDESNHNSLWVRDPDGAFHLIVRQGDVLELEDGSQRRVGGFGGIYSPDGRRNTSGLNDSGEVLFNVGFTDGSWGVLVSEVAAHYTPGDTNGDRVVDLADFGALKAGFGEKGARFNGDLDGNRRVDLSDFGLLKANFGHSAAVPEPATFLLALMAGAGLLAAAAFRRRCSTA